MIFIQQGCFNFWGLGNSFLSIFTVLKNVFIVQYVSYLYGVEVRQLQTIGAVVAYFGGIDVADETVTAVVTDLLLVENAFFMDSF